MAAKACPRRRIVQYACLLLPALFADAVHAQFLFVSPAEAQRRQQVRAALVEIMGTDANDAVKFETLRDAMTVEPSPFVRRDILVHAARLPGEVVEDWLGSLLKNETDGLVRGHIASLLGQKGSPKSVDLLILVGRGDEKTQSMISDDVIVDASARPQALFALAQIARRFPKVQPQVIEALRLLQAKDDPADNEGIYDVRLEALYQITGRAELLRPFLKRFESPDANVRGRGVIAFRFLALRKAPPELVERLRDPSDQVRSWVALVLGEIGDVEGTAPLLMAMAEDANADRFTRANAIVSLGRMRAQAAAPLMERLARDGDTNIAYHAAAALALIKKPQTQPASATSRPGESSPRRPEAAPIPPAR